MVDVVTRDRERFDSIRNHAQQSRGEPVVAAESNATYHKYRQKEKPRMYLIGIMADDGNVITEDQKFLNVGKRHFKITAYMDGTVSGPEMARGDIPINVELFNYTFRESALIPLPFYARKVADGGLASLKKELDSLNSLERAV